MYRNNVDAGHDPIDHDVMMVAVRQLIGRIEPFIRDAITSEQAEEVLVHMEENDRRFHQYELVKLVRVVMEDKVGSLIEEEIERDTAGHTQTLGQDTLVEKIVDKIINSQQYSDIMKTVKASVGDCLDQLSENFDEEFRTVSCGNAEMSHYMKVGHSYSFSDEESSFGSSLNQSSLMFMNQDKFHQIAENMEKSKTLSVRRQALKNLLQIPSMDIQGSEQWGSLRAGLLDALLDPDDQLYSLSLSFCAKGFSSSSTNTREIYSTLVEHLMFQFNSIKTSLPKVQYGLDLQAPHVSRIILACRLIHDFQMRIPSYWVRQSPKFLDDILDCTLQLFSVKHRNNVSAHIAPVHILSLIDPKAGWFIKWMHGDYSRQPLLVSLSNKYRTIMDRAVRHCLCYVQSRPNTTNIDIDQLSQQLANEHIVDGVRTKYTCEELQYAYFVHSIIMVTKLLFYEHGREFFPVKLSEPEDHVTISTFLMTMISLIHNSDNSSPAGQTAKSQYDSVVLVVDLMRRQCISDQSLDVCMCQDDVIQKLLQPITDWNQGHVPIISNTALLYVADIISMIAASSRGRHHILYGRHRNVFTHDGSSAANKIAQFLCLALNDKLINQRAGFPSRSVIGAFMYTCRQLYSDCGGLTVMSKLDICQVLSTSWKAAYREADMAITPTPSEPTDSSGGGGSGSSIDKESKYLLLWEDTLRDNLLNFTCTPRGVLLLQLTGAINECANYMYARYVKKLQVSKYEKYGYGFMLSQVAATSPGMVALNNTGFMEALISELWYMLEAGTDEISAAPKVWPLQPMDRHVHKPMISLMNILSSYPAIYELLAKKSLPCKKNYSLREVPSNLVELLDRLVIVNTPSKLESLFNYQQSHMFGLRLLSILVSSLDTCLLLESQYKFQEFLLQSQMENVSGDDKSQDIIIDMLSVERNYILVKSYLVGGPSEKTLPGRSHDQSYPYPYPMFVKLSLPREYSTPPCVSNSAPDSELSKFLTESKKTEHCQKWLDECKIVFCSVLSTKPELATMKLIQELLERFLPVLLQNKTELTEFPKTPYRVNENVVKSVKLSAVTTLGVQYTIRYGTHLKLLSSSSSDKLISLHKQIHHFLSQYQHKQTKIQSCYNDGYYKGYDWFTATVFLLMGGSKEKTWALLYKIAPLLSSVFLWPARAHASSHIREDLSKCGISPIYYSTGHAVELVLQTELCEVFSAFKMSGYTPSQICQHWFCQCLWNYLDWLDICHYVSVCLLLGADYQIYVCVALLKHLQPLILHRTQNQDLIIFLKEEAITNFKLGDHLEYMQQLEIKYRKLILPDMVKIIKPQTHQS